MDCKEVRNLLSEYLEGEDFAQKEFVREHLATCKDCASELKELKATISTLAGVKKQEVPGDFLEGVHRKLKPQPQINEIWKKLFYPLHIKLPLEAVAIAATVFLVLTIYNQSVIKPKSHQLIVGSEVTKAPAVMLPEKETTITLVSHDIDRDLKLLPVLVDEVGGKIIVPPKEVFVDEKIFAKLQMTDRMELKKAPAPMRSFDMTFQIPQDKMPIFMQKLEAITPSRAEYERAFKLKEAPQSEPVIIRLKLNSPQ